MCYLASLSVVKEYSGFETTNIYKKSSSFYPSSKILVETSGKLYPIPKFISSLKACPKCIKTHKKFKSTFKSTREKLTMYRLEQIEKGYRFLCSGLSNLI